MYEENRPTDSNLVKRENIGFTQILFNQIAKVIDAFSRVQSYVVASDFSANVQYLNDSIEATETLLFSFLDDDYWKTKKLIETAPCLNFERVHAERLKHINKFDLNMMDEVNRNRTLYYERQRVKRLRSIFREIIRWCAKNRLLFDLDKELET